ncbi:hypothetical protein QCA50_020955 [Cerrena zonata]|uniref:Protein kinase domain-containing protein n=1 Tax=Cerrena zonata TaxID=2478898 RepID=A0AAW0FC31_9APHY
MSTIDDTVEEWPRERNGGLLPTHPPEGHRPPNGCMWGHDPSEFCYIRRHPDSNRRTIWTRSMLQDFNECYDRELECKHFSNPDINPKPRLRRPWPVLKVPKARNGCHTKKVSYDPPLGHIDEGSDHDDIFPWDVVLEDSDDDDAVQTNKLHGAMATDKVTKTRIKVSTNSLVDSTDRVLPPWLPYTPMFTSWWKSVTEIRVSDISAQPCRLRFVAKRPSKRPKKRASSKKFLCIENDGEDADTEDCTDTEPLPPTVTHRGASSLYNLANIPVLQEHIPIVHFPDILHVHDPFDLSMGDTTVDHLHGATVSHANCPVRYERLWPPPNSPTSTKTKRNIAQLYLSPQNEVGTGHHSVVYASPLQLPSPLTTYNSASARPGTVRVMAKVAIQDVSARKLLNNEGEIYNSFPQHFSEEYCGFHILTPEMRTLVPSVAVTPKFFGYYIPSDGGDTALTPTWEQRSPILLIEDCGEQISIGDMTPEDRIDCYSLLVRLHFAEYMHNSFKQRNIVVQPGPLTAPPEARSMDTPSFRVIDFGRTESYCNYKASALYDFQMDPNGVYPKDDTTIANIEWSWGCHLMEERRKARRELRFGQYDF